MAEVKLFAENQAEWKSEPVTVDITVMLEKPVEFIKIKDDNFLKKEPDIGGETIMEIIAKGVIEENGKGAIATAVSMFRSWETDQFEAAVEYAVDYCERAYDPWICRWDDIEQDVHEALRLEMEYKRGKR